MTVLSLPPTPLISGVRFGLARIQATNPSRDASYQAVDLATPLWVCEIQSKQLDRRTAGLWRSLFAKKRGAQRTVYVYDASQQVPQSFYGVADIGRWALASSSELASSTAILASAVGAIHPWGTPKVESVNATAGTMTLSGFVPGISLMEGDYGHWDDSYKRRLQIITADATVASDGTVTITVEPSPPSSVIATLPVPFVMYRAAAEMVISGEQLPFDTSNKWSAQFVGQQVLRRSA